MVNTGHELPTQLQVSYGHHTTPICTMLGMLCVLCMLCHECGVLGMLGMLCALYFLCPPLIIPHLTPCVFPHLTPCFFPHLTPFDYPHQLYAKYGENGKRVFKVLADDECVQMEQKTIAERAMIVEKVCMYGICMVFGIGVEIIWYLYGVCVVCA